MIPAPKLTPDPIWKRVYLQVGTPVMGLITQVGLIARDLKTAVCCRRRMVDRKGMPKRRHLDRYAPQLPRCLQVAQLAPEDEQWLRDLGNEIARGLPTDLTPFLTRPLPPLASRLLAALAAPRRQS